MSWLSTTIRDWQTDREQLVRRRHGVIETACGSKNRPTGRTFRVTEAFLERCSRPVLCASFCRFIRVSADRADPNYLYWWFQSSYRSGRMAAFNTQHTGVSRFQWTDFASSTRLALPTRSAQRRIAALLAALDELIAINERRTELLEDLARSLYSASLIPDRGPGEEGSEACPDHRVS